MRNVFNNILESIGNTPLIRINRLNPNPMVTIYAKLESHNPGGSIKDRPALYMIEAAERSGKLTPDKIIIEATSGNTGIGLAMVAAVKGYRITLVMPETASLERQKILKALGAEVLLTPGSLGTDGAIEEVYRLVRQYPDRYFMADQFNNEANPEAHYYGTGPEIYEQTEGRVDAVVCTLGTSGTAMGVAKALKERDPRIKIVGVEPYPGHKIQGLKNMKESYVPGIFDRRVLDLIIHIKDEDAFEMARRLAREEGLFVGMSSGAAMVAAAQLASEMESGTIVAIFPDGGERYLSTNLFTTMLEPDFCFYDFLRREKIDFKPVKEGKIRILVTGPPLDCHLKVGDARRLLIADILARFLKTKGFDVRSTIPLIDLDTRTVHASIESSTPLANYVKQQRNEIIRDLNRLGLADLHEFPCISEHIDYIVDYTRNLIAKGLAYEKLRSVYFNLTCFEDYGRLSGMDPTKIKLGVTVDLEAYEKLNPRDFALLKRTSLAELKEGIFIKTEWGNVLPTWHISTVSVAYNILGNPVDIHVSSVEFLFPYLENVRALGEALTGKPFANVWMLCERTQRSQEFDQDLSIRDLLAKGYPAAELRYWLLTTHYRKPIYATYASLENAIRSYRRIQEFLARIYQSRGLGPDNPHLPELIFSLEQQFFDALADDLNTPKAIAAVFRFVRNVNRILDESDLSETQYQQIMDVFNRINGIIGVFDLEAAHLTREQMELIRLREEARRRKDWQEADRLREILRKQGIQVVDTPKGPRWKRIK